MLLNGSSGYKIQQQSNRYAILCFFFPFLICHFDYVVIHEVMWHHLSENIYDTSADRAVSNICAVTIEINIAICDPKQ